MKTRIFTICIMVAALAMFAPVAAADFKVTGGGWIIDGDSRPTFGLQIKGKCNNYNNPDTCISIGNLQYNDRNYPIKIHSKDVKYETSWDNQEVFVFSGSCRIQSKDYEDENGSFQLTVSEGVLGIIIFDENGDIFPGMSTEPDLLGGGNIKIQVK
ncbi:MAG: hypothetical protein JRD05_11230 [Deltaproteobacteria bacterium]|nr:hypothetical protein [Deltaproteobacteria bacterium]